MKLTRDQITECIVALQFAELWWKDFKNSCWPVDWKHARPELKVMFMFAPMDNDSVSLLQKIERKPSFIKHFEALDDGR